MSAQIYTGTDEKVSIRINESGTYKNIDNLLELYVVVTGRGGRVISKYNKGGTGGCTALIKTNTTTYYFWLDSSLTKDLVKDTFKIGINYAETEADLTDDIRNTTSEVDLFDVIESKAKIFS
jgi:hypothetical protein